jgi:hypothetical protein
VKAFITRNLEQSRVAVMHLKDTTGKIVALEKFLEPILPKRWIALGVMQILALTILAACNTEAVSTSTSVDANRTNPTELSSSEEKNWDKPYSWTLTPNRMLETLSTKNLELLSVKITTQSETYNDTDVYEVAYQFDTSGKYTIEGYKDSHTIAFFRDGEKLGHCVIYLDTDENGQDMWRISTAHVNDTNRLRLTIDDEKIDGVTQQALKVAIPSN